MSDPLPGPAVAQGTWASVGVGHRLLYVGDDRVLDWVPASGDYRLWRVDRSAAGAADPLPGPAVAQGNWASVRAGHELVYLGHDRVLDWEPASGDYRVWKVDRSATGSADPLPGPALASGKWASVGAGHQLISLDGDRVLDWEPASGDYRIWRHDPSASGSADPLPGPAVVSGNWASVRAGHVLVYLGGDRVLDWEPASGDYRIWRYDRSVTSGDPFPGPAVVSGNWASVRAGHELIYLDKDRVLDWEPATGGYHVWRYDRTAKTSKVRLHFKIVVPPQTRTVDDMLVNMRKVYDQASIEVIEVSRETLVVNDPLPGPAVAQGTWASVGVGHRLVYVGDDRVLDWVPASGDYRLWRVDRSAAGAADPLPGPAVAQGNWASVRAGHELVYLGHDRVLDWEPASGDYRVWKVDRSATGAADPLPGPALASGKWASVGAGHQLISLDGDRVLDWEPASGDYRIWRHDPSASGSADPLPGPAVVSGNWASVRAGHVLVYLGGDRVLDWEPADGSYRVWKYDRSVTSGDPLPGPALTQGFWDTVQTGHELVFLDKDRVLDWEPASGKYHVWRVDLRGLSRFADLDRGACPVPPSSSLTPEQEFLQRFRGSAGPHDVVVFLVRTLLPSAFGCSTHPAGKPAVIIGSDPTPWTLAHEIGHVLGLTHVASNTHLMFGGGTDSITKNPPELDASEIATMINSDITEE